MGPDGAPFHISADGTGANPGLSLVDGLRASFQNVPGDRIRLGQIVAAWLEPGGEIRVDALAGSMKHQDDTRGGRGEGGKVSAEFEDVLSGSLKPLVEESHLLGLLFGVLECGVPWFSSHGGKVTRRRDLDRAARSQRSQSALAYADNELTLSTSAKAIFECEANQAGAELLFQGRRFGKIAAEYETGMGAVGALRKRTGASLRATLRRYAEDHAGAVCGIYLAPSPCGTEPLAYRRFEVSQSAAWTSRFGRSWPRVLDAAGFPFIATIADPVTGQDGRLTWPDLDCEPVSLKAEATWTRFGVLLLLWVPRREILRRRRRLVVAAT
jgi:hypothetical protein